jgi:hypothetical protein
MHICPEESDCIVASILEVLLAVVLILFMTRIKHFKGGVVSSGTICMSSFVKICPCIVSEVIRRGTHGRMDTWTS